MTNDLSCFFQPEGVAVIGASNRTGSWGNRITQGLIASRYPGALYPVNSTTDNVLGLKAYPGLREIPGPVDLAVVAIPAESLWKTLEDCALKGVKGVVIISSGFGEVKDEGKRLEERIAVFGRENNIRILGPNVSGIYDLHAGFYAAGGDPERMIPSRMSFVCQGGFAVHNIVNHAYARGIGIGKFVQTGNEADLQSTDFVEFLGDDPHTEVILMYIEGLKDPKRFLKVAKEITPKKPIIFYKGGKSHDGSRAAASHTGAMAGSFDLYRALIKQARCIMATHFETILDFGKALTYYPHLRGPRIGIATQGGSWGVMLTDQLSLKGFSVPELSDSLQKDIRGLGFPSRASTKNPIDFGAAGETFEIEKRVRIIECLLSSPELDAVIIHGYGQIGLTSESLPDWVTKWQEEEEEVLRKAVRLMGTYAKPLLIGSHITHFESATIRNLVMGGIPVYNRLEDIIDILGALQVDGINRFS
ncbi:MAG: CoA-binding protein [Pseudomonadota bacterium]